MLPRGVIYLREGEDKKVEIVEKLDPMGKVITVKKVELRSSETKNEKNAMVGLLEFLSTITHSNLIKIESCRPNAVSPALDVYMEAAQTDGKQYLNTATYCQWDFEEYLVPQIDGLVEVLAYAQKQGRAHGRVVLEHILITADYYMKLTGFSPVTRGREVSISRALDPMYLSPLRAAIVSQQRLLPGYNDYKADVYSLGICMLMIAYTGKEEHAEALRRREIGGLLQGLQAYPGLYARLTEMLNLDDSIRPDFIQLEAFITHLKASLPASKPSQPAPVQPLCPTCHSPLTDNLCSHCASNSKSPGKSPRKFKVDSAQDEPEIVSSGSGSVCLQCKRPFMQRYKANLAAFEGQFQQFCSEDCVVQHAIEESERSTRPLG